MARTRSWKSGVAVASIALSGIGGASTAAAGADTREITIWVPALMAEASRAFPEGFEEAAGDVSVEIETIPDPFEQNVLTKWAAGERPDVLYFHGIGNWIVQLNPQANLEDLGDMDFVDATLDGLLENSTEFGGTIYGALLDFPNVDGVFYNRQVFDEQSLSVPGNFAELLEMCATIRADSDVIPIDIAGGDKWPLQVLPFMLFNDALKADPEIIDRLNSNEAHFTDDTFVDGYRGLLEAQDAGCFNDDASTSTFEQTQERLMSGEAAMTVNLSGIATILSETYGPDVVSETVGFFPLARESTVSSWQTAGLAVYVPSAGDVETARQYVDWATGAGYQGYVDALGQYPVLEGATDPAGIVAPLVEAREAFDTDTIPQYQQNLQASYGVFEDYLSAMMFDGETPEWVGEQMQTAFERSAATIGLPGF